MDNINKLIENIPDKDLNAVLYGVMLRFLKRKAKENDLYVEHLTLSVDEDNKTIELFSDRNSKGEIGQYLIEEIEVN